MLKLGELPSVITREVLVRARDVTDSNHGCEPEKRPGGRGAFRRANSHDELVARKLVDSEKFAIFDKNRVAIALGVFSRGAYQRALMILPIRSSTAIRMATPFLTCSVITDRELSARAPSISIPRFIGPGCMTIASGFASFMFS